MQRTRHFHELLVSKRHNIDMVVATRTLQFDEHKIEKNCYVRHLDVYLKIYDSRYCKGVRITQLTFSLFHRFKEVLNGFWFTRQEGQCSPLLFSSCRNEKIACLQEINCIKHHFSLFTFKLWENSTFSTTVTT